MPTALPRLPADTETDPARYLEMLRQSTVGLHTRYRLADGRETARVYLDSSASTLQLGVVNAVLQRFLPLYASTHTDVHFGAQLANYEYRQAHQTVLQFVHADAATHGCFFVGSGATAGLNRVAATLARWRPERDVVIVSAMEHHSNDLPHRQHTETVLQLPLARHGGDFETVDLTRLEQLLRQHDGRVNYVAVTGVSNVTGIVNPIYAIAGLAHRYGALIVVDAAQMAAHLPLRVSNREQPNHTLDVVCLSGHKLYAPMSPGAVVARLEPFTAAPPQELGGGMVDDVFANHFIPTATLPERAEAGTPNIAGAIALASALQALDTVGMDYIAQREAGLMRYAIEALGRIDEVVIYGQTDPGRVQRIGALSFNLRDLPHGLTAAILNDYFNIAVRNACFCAHPYVRELIGDALAEYLDMDNLSNAEMEALAELHRGMVRASFALYNRRQDVDFLVAAVKKICADKAAYARHYRQCDNGDYVHTQFRFDHRQVFSTRQQVADWFARGFEHEHESPSAR